MYLDLKISKFEKPSYFQNSYCRCHTTLIAGLAAQKFGKPVRLTLTTSEDMLFAGAKHEVVVNYKVTFDTNGKIVTATFKAFANSGCSLDNSVVWTQASF